MNKAGSCQQSQQIQLNRNLSLNLNLNLNLNHNLYLNQNLSHNLCLSQNQTKIQKQSPPGPPRGGVGGRENDPSAEDILLHTQTELGCRSKARGRLRR